MKTMIAARLHEFGAPMRLDRIPVPEPRPTDVLVEVKACGIVPNLARVIANFFGTQVPDRKGMPPLPAIFGLDPTGVIAAVGSEVRGISPGTRVYVNPARCCGGCRLCRSGQTLDCPNFTFQGYFGRSQEIMKAYPYGGFAQYITAPAAALVKLPDTVSYEGAARFGYFGTAYAAMRKIGVAPGQYFFVNGISGTLGLCAAMVGLAMGATKILGAARDEALLARVRALAPGRIETFAFRDGPGGSPAKGHASGDAAAFADWVKSVTDGYGLDCLIDCLPPGTPVSAMMVPLMALRRGGRAASVGGVMETLPMNAFWLMTNRIQLQGSVWFTPAEGEDLAAMASAGTLDLSVLEHRVSPLAQINEAIAGMNERSGGFTNFVIDMTRAE